MSDQRHKLISANQFTSQDLPTSPSARLSENDNESDGGARYRGGRRGIDPITSSPGTNDWRLGIIM